MSLILFLLSLTNFFTDSRFTHAHPTGIKYNNTINFFFLNILIIGIKETLLQRLSALKFFQPLHLNIKN